MKELSFKLTTTAPIVNCTAKNYLLFAVKKSKMYIINRLKFSEILFFLRLAEEFYSFIAASKSRDISEWLKSKNLFSDKILEEICISCMKCSGYKNITQIHSFESNDSNHLYNFVQNSLKNLFVFNYLELNQSRINKYVKNLIYFFKKDKTFYPREKSFQFFANCLFEVEKEQLSNYLAKFDFGEITEKYNKNIADYFCIQKISENLFTSYYECIKKDVILDFSAKCNDFYNIKKLLALSKQITDLRIKQESSLLKELQINAPEKFFEEEEKIKTSNMNFLNLNQTLYLNLSEENRLLLNEFFNYNINKCIFPFSENADKTLHYINYAKIEIC